MSTDSMKNWVPAAERASLMGGELRLGMESSKPREPCRQADFDQLYLYCKPKKPGLRERLGRSRKRCDPRSSITSLFPITEWLWNYRWKQDLCNDIISGATVAIMHIPHGIAYSMLGGVPPVVGIYMAFFPVFIYVIMGTSRHISMGTFSVVCIMTSKSVLMYADTDSSTIASNGSVVLESLSETNHTGLSPIQVAAGVSVVVGFWQVLMGVLQLGVLSVLLSETLVSGFTTGAAIHVITSQISKFFGIKLPRRMGPLKILYAYYDLFVNIQHANLVTMGISLITVFILFIYNEYVKGRIEKKLPIPIPIELFAVIIGTAVSYLADFEHVFGVKTIGHVPTGLPQPELPPLSLLPNLLVDGLVISLVAFSVNMSMAKILARKAKYSVSANQELLASGCANVFGSFFGCIPIAASLSRSMIQQTVGGKTQLASLVSCLLLLFVLLFVGPLFQPLPNCVLASIVVVALKGMLLQVRELPRAWKQSHADGLTWLASFLGVVLLDIDYGLGLGVAFSVLTLLIRGQKPQIRTLGNVPGTQIYLDMQCYQSVVAVPGVKILQIAGGLHFANKDYLHQKILNLVGDSIVETDLDSNTSPKISHDNKQQAPTEIKPGMQTKLSSLVLNMASVSFVDPSAIKTLTSLYKDFKSRGVIFSLALCSCAVNDSMKKCNFFDEFPDTQLFPSVHEAVIFAVHQQ